MLGQLRTSFLKAKEFQIGVLRVKLLRQVEKYQLFSVSRKFNFLIFWENLDQKK